MNIVDSNWCYRLMFNVGVPVVGGNNDIKMHSTQTGCVQKLKRTSLTCEDTRGLVKLV